MTILYNYRKDNYSKIFSYTVGCKAYINWIKLKQRKR